MSASGERFKHASHELWVFLRYLADRFIRDECLESASTLAYTTLLSLVPLLTVVVAVLSAFPVFDAIAHQLKNIVLANLVPSFGATVEAHLARFVDRAAGVTAAGAVGVFVSALLMISAIDGALNRIWHVHKHRRPVQGFMVYWTVLTLSPVLIGASLALSSYLLTVSQLVNLEQPGPLAGLLLRALPFLGQTGAFLFLYTAVPNRRVSVRHALIGALVAATLFELAKAGFALYVQMMPGFEAIYGALASIPLFLVWLYVCWLIILGGAEVTQALGAYKSGSTGPLAAERWRFVATLRVAGHLWRAQQRGESVNRRDLARAEPQLGDRGIQTAIEILESARLVQRTARGGWMLARDLSSFTMLDLYRAYPFTVPLDHTVLDPNDSWDSALLERLQRISDELRSSFNVPLSVVFSSSSEPEMAALSRQGGS